ncbi:MAG: ABC transporter permease [Flavobacteriales bacterium]|nr:ABC transporter permease [Flavobacteriales bacterium]MBX2958783.1 ABC transporter permease [Flavobacteriales bacterium]MCL4856817.1 FtsX-like permease family protein [Flavobacteriales bacterium]HRN40528.1 FtsX-like permease family protein [Vicingus sp.]
MNLPFYIAKRYLISKKSHHVINIISWISVSGIGVATMALVIVLSAFNGLQTLVETLYASFDPDIKITAVVGKTFNSNTIPKDKILAIEGVQFYTESLEDVALFKYSDKQTVATLKGVEETFYEITGLDTLIYEGEHKKDSEQTHYLNLGYGIANNLSLFINSEFNEEVSVIIPKKGQKKSFIPGEEFSRKFATASGVYSIGPDFDNKYVLASLPFVQTLFDKENQISSVELKLKNDANWKKVKAELSNILGKNFVVKTRYELNELVYKTNETEKWITFLILSFILVIASFNIIGSLTMLILDKKEDVWILKTMGANNKLIQQLFFAEGMLINLLGAFCGMILGTLLCWIQMEFGLLRLNGGIVDFYPIEMKWIDFLSIFSIVFFIGVIASWFPVRMLTRKYL